MKDAFFSVHERIEGWQEEKNNLKAYIEKI